MASKNLKKHNLLSYVDVMSKKKKKEKHEICESVSTLQNVMVFHFSRDFKLVMMVSCCSGSLHYSLGRIIVIA